MFTLLGPQHRYCDRASRRNFLKVGSLALGGLSLPALLRAEARQGTGGSHKSVIMVYLSGGMAHQDTFDLKPDAPDEIRGEFKPISTNVPGVQVGELLPKMATVMDRVALVRSIVGMRDEHSSFQNLTGYTMGVAQREGRPNFGSVIARLAGPVDPVVPPFVDLFPTMQHRPYNSPGPGMLGHAAAGTKADGEDLASMKLRYVSSEEFSARRNLLAGFDDFRRAVDSSGVERLDAAYRRAFDVLTSSKLASAMDVEKEDPAVRERYGRGSPQHQGDGAPEWNDQLLMARRLVEAGARCVTVAYGFWDTHGNNFGALKERVPLFDQGISALVEDIYQRGLDRDVTVVVWGEFGRTPKINKDAGRDHWAPVNFALMFGGGMRTGQVIGATDKIGAYATARRVPYLDVLATIYHNLGLDPHTFVKDLADRPVGILPEGSRPIAELV
ncbi:MAG TPA: DUF1501 domain-containing protein [Pirellulales bacterium]|nr:DUF1501 domain-containing protein [Pirellulales bacterium]